MWRGTVGQGLTQKKYDMERRKFLQKSGGAGAGMMVAGRLRGAMSSGGAMGGPDFPVVRIPEAAGEYR
jgi:hypothetical protein